MKKYSIGGKDFELQPLTLRQRQLAAPVQKKLMLVIQSTVTTGLEKIKKLQKILSEPEVRHEDLAAVLAAMNVNEEIQNSIGINVDLEAIVLAEDKSFLKFLATILTPVGSIWTPKCIDENIDIMLEIDESTQQEVLQSFLFSRPTLNSDSMSFTKDSQNGKKQSDTNESSAG